MNSRASALPFLPGFVFRSNIGKTNFPRKPYVNTLEGVRMPIDKTDPHLPGKIHERQPSLFARGEVAEIPPWIQFDGEVLRFDAFYQEPVHESIYPYQIHKCKISFYLEDGTIKVNEPKIMNSGLCAEKIISRQRIPLPPPKDEYFFDLCDLNVGKEVEFFGKYFKITDCDAFTRTFLQRLGITVPNPVDMPIDPYIEKREKDKNAVYPKKKNPHVDKFGQFNDFDRVVLRFYGYWDDRYTGGNLHDLTLYYYLADNTIQLVENEKDNCGKKSSNIFIKRGKIPKFFTGLPAPGHFDDFTVLNVLGPNLRTGRYVIDPLNCGQNNEQYYEPQDLIIGAAINVYDRKIILTDCDPFTKEYYRKKYGIDDFTPIKRPVEKKDVVKIERKLPPWNGFGSYQDSEENCGRIHIKPLPRDYTQFMKLDKFGMECHILRFLGVLRSKLPNQCEKKCVINYYLSDNAISIYELAKNLRVDGRTFFHRSPIVIPGQEVFTSEAPDIFLPQHMFVGANVVLNGFNFILVEADQYTLRYMELHCDEFPKADINKILKKVREKLKPIYKDFVATMVPSKVDLPLIPYDILRDKLCPIMGDDWCEHEMITLARNFSGVCRSERFSREFIRQVAHAEMKRHIWDDLDRLKEYFRAWDAQRTGYLPVKDIACLIKTCKLPFDKQLIEYIIKVLVKNDKCEVEAEDFYQFLDVNSCPMPSTIPINIKNVMWFASELDPVPGKLIDWCAFNKALDLMSLFKEPIIIPDKDKKKS